MSFFGKEYVLDRQENFDAFVDALGVDILTPEAKQALLNSKPTMKLEKNGDTYVLHTSRPEKNVITFKNGQEVDETVAGRAAKSTFKFEGNTLTQEQKFENGQFFNFKRVFSDSGVVTTATSSKFDGEARRYYKAV